MRFGVIPVRVASGCLVVATCDVCFEEASVALPTMVDQKLKFVIAPAEQVRNAIAAYYP
jgi:hypothetical protein